MYLLSHLNYVFINCLFVVRNCPIHVKNVFEPKKEINA